MAESVMFGRRRGRLALSGLVALAALGSACASSGAVPRPFPGAPVVRQAPAPALPGLSASPGEAVVDTALALRGVPYRNGGDSPGGFDCSGFTQYVFAHHGVALPRDTRAQFDVGDEIASEAIEAGDLLFFSTTASGPTHVAIAISVDEFVHAPSSAGVVRVERRSLPYWSARYLGARRIRGGGSDRTRRPSGCAELTLADQASRRVAFEVADVEIVLRVPRRRLTDPHLLDLDAFERRIARWLRGQRLDEALRIGRKRAEARGNDPAEGGFEPGEVVLQKLQDSRVRSGLEVDLHHRSHLLEERVAVAVGGVGPVSAVNPSDPGQIGIDVIELVHDRVEPRDPVVLPSRIEALLA